MKKKIIICLSVAMCMLLTIGFAAQNYLSAEEETISVMIRAKNNISAQTFSADAQEETAGEITVEDIAPSELGDLKENQMFLWNPIPRS